MAVDLNDKLFLAVLDSMGILTDDEDVKKRIWAKYAACRRYLLKSGASEQNLTAESDEAVETIALGVNDLLNGVPGKTEFSPAFRLLSMHLASIRPPKNEVE